MTHSSLCQGAEPDQVPAKKSPGTARPWIQMGCCGTIVDRDLAVAPRAGSGGRASSSGSSQSGVGGWGGRQEALLGIASWGVAVCAGAPNRGLYSL